MTLGWSAGAVATGAAVVEVVVVVAVVGCCGVVVESLAAALDRGWLTELDVGLLVGAVGPAAAALDIDG